MRFFVLAVCLAAVGCGASMPPFVINKENDHFYSFRQPQNAEEWQQVKDAGITDIVKLNAPDEGPDGFSDDYATTLGIRVHLLTIEPRGDGPLSAQVEGVFTRPDPARVEAAQELLCDKTIRTGLHCTHTMDRSGYLRARERVVCDGWSLEAAHEEWHRRAQYVPHGVRIPSPGLEADWEDFAEAWREAHPSTTSSTPPPPSAAQ